MVGIYQYLLKLGAFFNIQWMKVLWHSSNDWRHHGTTKQGHTTVNESHCVESKVDGNHIDEDQVANLASHEKETTHDVVCDDGDD